MCVVADHLFLIALSNLLLQHVIRAPRDAVVGDLFFKENDFVADGKLLCAFEKSANGKKAST